MSTAALRPLSAGELLDQSFGLYRRYLPQLAMLSLICTSVPQLLLASITVRMQGAATGGDLFGLVPEYLAVLVLFLVLSQLAIGASTVFLSESYLGRSVTVGQALRRAGGSIAAIILLSIMSGFVVGLGFMLIFVPGLILLCGLAVATPALVMESGLSAGGAMARSWELTRGYRWRMFLLLLVPFVLISIFEVGVSLVMWLATGAMSMRDLASPVHSQGINIASAALSLLVRTVLTPLFYCVLTVTYYDLRVRTEGFDLEMLAASITGA